MSATSATAFPYRQIHLDFHTGPAIPDVGEEFDAREFARTMKAANVNSVTVFAKCHHGHLYYDTDRPERHPGLRRDLDLLKQQVDALHSEGIRAPIYISVQCDEYAANLHPEWVARKPDSSMVMWRRGEGEGWFNPGWQILDMSTGYQDFLAEQTQEILRLFQPVDGIFFDMCWDQPSITQEAIAGMLKSGLNPEREEDRIRYSRQVSLAYMERFHSMVRESSPDATVYFNGRPMSNLPDEIRFLEQVEIEALPTGGWGYTYFPKNVRFARQFGKPYLGMTARFHKSWADFGGIKPYAALEYETSQMIAHGARCSVGDQLHPRGTLDRAAYELIGNVYGRVAEREPWLEGTTPVTQIGLFQVPTATANNIGVSGTDEGATRLLTQLKHQFDVVDATSDFGRYELLILPDAIPVDAALAERLRAFIQNGGRLLLSGTSGLNSEGTEALFPELGVAAHGISPFTATYVRFGNAVTAGVPPTDHIFYNRAIRVTPEDGTEVLASVVEPYFERNWQHFCSHAQTPGDRESTYAAAVRRGNIGYIPYPIFGAYAEHGNIPYKLLVRNLLSLLLPEPLIRIEAPSSTEVSVMRQEEQGRTIVHLLHYVPERRTAKLDIVEDITPLFQIPLSIAMPEVPRRVYIAPSREEVPFKFESGRVAVTVPEIRGHQMVVFESGEAREG
jgi:hypothetical protein